MDLAQQQEMNEQFRGRNCRMNHFYVRSDSGNLLGTSGPPRVPSEAQYSNILPIPFVYETRRSTKFLIYLYAAKSIPLWKGPCRTTF